jgi:hypothetical protein
MRRLAAGGGRRRNRRRQAPWAGAGWTATGRHEGLVCCAPANARARQTPPPR